MIGDTFDLYAPRRVAVHTAAEVRGWYEAAGCGKIRSLPVATGLSFSGMKAAREALELMAS